MENLTTQQLLKELSKRGYAVQYLWGENDVQAAVESYNELYDTDYSLSNEDKVTIMNEVLDDDYIFQQINENIEAMVFNILNEVNK